MTIERVRVGDVLSLQRRSVVVEPDVEYEEIGVRSFGRGIFHKDPVTGVDLAKKRVFRIEPGDLVISNVFAWEGAVAVASDAESGKIGSHRFMTFVPIDRRAHPRWLYWFFRSEAGLELMRRASPGSAGRNRTLAVKRFEALELPLPPLEEQRRVAGLLDRAQSGVAVVSGLLEKCGSLASAAQVSLTAPTSLTDADYAAQGWVSVELGNVMRPSTQQVTVDPASDYRLAGIYSFGRGLIDRGLLPGFQTSYKTLTVLSEGDVVVSKLNGWEGAVAVVDAGFDGSCVSSEFPVFKLDLTRLLPVFFRGIAKSPSFWEALDSSARGSMVRRRRISGTEFLRARVRLPSLEVQSEAAQRAEVLDRVAARRIRSRERVSALIPALLNREFAATT